MLALRDAIARVLKASDARILRSAVGATVVWQHTPKADPRIEAEKLRRLIAASVDDVSAGVAGPKHGAYGAHFAVVQAEYALTVGRGLHGHGHTVHFDELGPLCFALTQPANDIRASAERLLGPLVADDRHDYLLDTLESYLRNGGVVKAVARQLFLHRNTVRHRMRRITTLIGADVDDPDMRLALQVAILGCRALDQIA